MMSNQALVDPAPGQALGATRGRVLGLLRATGAPMSVHEVAARTGLHRNTARFHLDGLAEAGLAERGDEDAGKPGRPRAVYHATTGPDAGQRSYRLLAEMLTSLITESVDQPRQAAVRAGKAWGRYLVDRPAPSESVDADHGLARLSRMLIDTGFAVDAVQETDAPVMALRQCPFREIADRHQDVVCSLHLGLMQGALDEVRAPLTADRLEPFVEPSLCLAHFHQPDSRARRKPSRKRTAG